MAYDLQTGSVGLRTEVIDAMVKQIAEPSYKFKQALSVLPTSAWKNTFFREDTTTGSGPSGNVFKGVPRGANFPHSDTTWTEVSVRIVKHAVETNIPWEDLLSDDISVQARTVIRRTREIVKSVDDDIWSVLTTNGNLVTSFAVETATHGAWDETSGALIDDLMKASRLISVQNYPVSDLICFVSPYDKQSIMNYLVGKGAQFPSIATEVANNGRIGRLAGVTLVEANSVTVSQALMVVPKTCATYKELVSLRSVATEDPLKSWRIRVVEEGVVEVTDPYAMVLMRGTQKA